MQMTLREFLEILTNSPKRKRRSRIPITDTISVKGIRAKTFKAKGVVCAHCGATPTKISFHRNEHREDKWNFKIYGYRSNGSVFYITVDHIIPKALGGSNRIENLQPLCNHCNAEKSDKKLTECVEMYHLNEILDDIYHKHKDDPLSSRFRKMKYRLSRIRCRQHTSGCAMIYLNELIFLLDKITRRYGFQYSIEECVPRIIPKAEKQTTRRRRRDQS